MKKNWIGFAAFAVAFCTLVVLLLTCNVAPVGPAGTQIGLSGLNVAVHQALGTNEMFYELTELFGLAALAICGIFGIAGLVQLIRRKSLKLVDRRIYALAGLYIVTVLLYVLFEKVVINYRPVLMPGQLEPEAAFPSSHTMLILVVFGSAVEALGAYIKRKGLRLVLQLVGILVMVLTVVGRLLSGVHWLTDIVGSVLLSLALLSLYRAVSQKTETRR